MDKLELIAAIKDLIESEEGKEETKDVDIRHLEDALDALMQFKSVEESDVPASLITPLQDGVVDTGVLTGPINGLKNFLMRKAQRND